MDLVEKALTFFFAAFFSASSASIAANFIIASRNGFSFSIAGDGGEGFGEQRLLMPLEDSTIMDWTMRRLVARALRCASELLPFLSTTWFWIPESESEFLVALSSCLESDLSFASSGFARTFDSWHFSSVASTASEAVSGSFRAAVTLGDEAGGGLSQTELEDDPQGDGEADEADPHADDSDVTPEEDVEEVRLSFVDSTVVLSSETDLKMMSQLFA